MHLSFWTSIAVIAVSAFICLEGFIILLWPHKVKEWLQEATPLSLRIGAVIEFLLGISVFMLLLWA